MNIEQKIRRDVEAILGPNGLAIQQGKHFNQNQLDYALNVASGLGRIEGSEKTQINAQQAATGTGKTLGYLIPLMSYCVHGQGSIDSEGKVSANRVAVSTYTRHLQKQIKDDDAELAVKWIAAVTGKTLKVEVRVGMRNYLSLHACKSLLDSFKNDEALSIGEHIGFLEAAITHLAESNECITVDDYLNMTGVDALPDRIERSKIGLVSTAPESELEQYRAVTTATKEADVLITNHALSVMNAWGFINFLDDKGRRTTACVFDEADRLDDMCRSMVTSDLSVYGLKKLIERLAGKQETLISKSNINDLFDYLVGLFPGSGDRFKLCDDSQGEGSVINDFLNAIIIDLEGFLRKISTSSKKVSAAKQLKLSHIETLDHLADDAEEALEQIKALRKLMVTSSAHNSEAKICRVVVSWSPVRTYPSLRIGRVYPGRIVNKLWHRSPKDDKQLRGILFTSATLTGIANPTVTSTGERKDNFNELFAKHGLKQQFDGMDLDYWIQDDLLQSFEPEKFGNLSFVVADEAVNRPTRRLEEEGEDGEGYETDPKWLKYCASMIECASSRKIGSPFPKGRTLVLTTSYADTEALAELLGDAAGLFVHKKGKPLNAYLNDFKETENAILITPGAWEGLDMPGLIKNLVITRMPFPRPNSIENQLRVLAGTHPEAKYNVNDAIRMESQSQTVRRLKQGIGRGIRSKDDSVVVWIADPRFPRVVGDKSAVPRLGLLASLGNKANTRAKQVSILAKAVPDRFKPDHAQALIFKESGVIV